MRYIILTMFLCLVFNIQAQINYENYFTQERLRYDYIIGGNDSDVILYHHRFCREPYWGGSYTSLIDTLSYGDMLLEVYDSVSGNLIYSRGYSTLFKEWQTVDEAKKCDKAFLETVNMPFPKRTVCIKISDRDKSLQYHQIHLYYLNPDSDVIELLKQPWTTIVQTIDSTDLPSKRTDIVFVAEGYTADQQDKFFSDAKRFKTILYSWEPYSSLPSVFNIYAVFVPSEEPGSDNSIESKWVNTALESNMNTFKSERYLTVADQHRLHDLIAGVPYDQICIMVNSDKYAGGGIYNFFTVFAADNENSGFLFHHEFAHSFASLGDEYYSSQVSYTDMYDLTVEPCEPNITTRVDFSKKWEHLIPDSVPVPTPDTTYYEGIVGLFEGAAYSAKGIYRPSLDCSMKSIISNAFCPVCRDAIRRMACFNGYRKEE